MFAIQARGLSKEYRFRSKEAGLAASMRALVRPSYTTVNAVNHIDFTVKQGEIVAFLGPNGAGKSTTIKMMTGILSPTSGDIRVLGMDPQKERRRLSYKMGTVFGQRSQLWFHLPPSDSFLLLGSIYEMEKADLARRMEELTERFGLGELLQTPVRKMSLGQRVRCEVAASLLHGPDILFLDEPTIGLDVVVRQQIRELIVKDNQERGTTIFITSHDTGDIEKICRRALVIDRGRLVLDESVHHLKHKFLKEKQIHAVFEEVESPFEEMEGVRVVRREGQRMSLDVNTARCAIEEVMRRLLAVGRISDITVEDPPMERVITAIFQGEEGRDEKDAQVCNGGAHRA